MVENTESTQGEYAKDGSVDLRGNPVLRSSRGGWTACSFIVGHELFERMAFHGISSNLVIYLAYMLHHGTVDAANNVTNWVGTLYLTPVLGAFIADAYLGRYWTFIIGSSIYLVGMCLLTLSVSIAPLKPTSCTLNCKPATALQTGVFFAGLYIVALGNGLMKPTISTIGADQFDEFDNKERVLKLSFFNWWMFSILLGSLFANTVLVYIQDNVGWSLGYGIPTVGILISILIFLSGTRYYRHKIPQGSPFTKMARVIVAAISKWKLHIPKDQKELYELDLEAYTEKGKFKIELTNSMRFLNKASMIYDKITPWTLCTVTEVEETKQILRLIPIWFAMFISCMVIAQTNTLFIKQGTTLDRHVVANFQIPPASLAAFVTISMLVSIVVYDRYILKIMRPWSKNPRGITLLQRIGTGMFLHTVTMMVAFVTERRRLSIAISHGLDKSGGQLPATIFIILPQFVLIGIADALLGVGVVEFFYDQAPESMKSLGASFCLTTFGVGNFLSSFILKLFSTITSKNGKGWIGNNLNASHLDRYYAFLAILCVLNFVFFLFVSKRYSYKPELCESTDIMFSEEQAERRNEGKG